MTLLFLFPQNARVFTPTFIHTRDFIDKDWYGFVETVKENKETPIKKSPGK